MTRKELLAATRRVIHNRTEITDAELLAAIQSASEALSRGRYSLPGGRIVAVHFKELDKVAEITLQNAKSDYAYPTDAAEIQLVEHDLNGDFKYSRLESRSWHEFGRLDVGRTGRPSIYTLHGRSIYITPWPDSSITGTKLRISYYGIPAVLTTDESVPEYAVPYHAILPFLAGHEILAQLSDEYSDKAYNSAMLRLSQIQDDKELTLMSNFNRPIPRAF